MDPFGLTRLTRIHSQDLLAFAVDYTVVAPPGLDAIALAGVGVCRCVAPCVGCDDTPAVWNMTLNVVTGTADGSFYWSSTIPIRSPARWAC